jgi:SDR family mycofactocin-dependent oxidoreductase
VGCVDGKVAFITGGARGQGRNHALRLAEEGADIVLIDLCGDIDSVGYPLASDADLDETRSGIEARGRRALARVADVRQRAAIETVLAEAAEAFGGLDIVCANAGVAAVRRWDDTPPELWRDIVDVNLTGVWNSLTAAAPHLIRRGGGSMICIGSTGSSKGFPYETPYVAAKHGVIGLMRSLANELARHHIRVNTVSPGGVNTPMIDGLSRLGIHETIAEDPHLAPLWMNAIPVDSVELDDISNAVLYLASDASRYITGHELVVDAGNTIR